MVFINPMDRDSDAWYSGEFHRARMPCQRQCQVQNAMTRCGEPLISHRRPHVSQQFTFTCFLTIGRVSPRTLRAATDSTPQTASHDAPTFTTGGRLLIRQSFGYLGSNRVVGLPHTDRNRNSANTFGAICDCCANRV